MTKLPFRSQQATLARDISLKGIGLHTGQEVKVVLAPAPENTGVIFRRMDALVDGHPSEIPAHGDGVVEVRLGTELGARKGYNAGVKTVEHLMAALAVEGIDNIRVDLDGPEIPILDGSSRGFLQALQSAGRVIQAANRAILEIAEAIEVRDGDRFIRAVPANRREFAVSIDFDDPVIGVQSVAFDLDDEPRVRAKLLMARTFCYRRDVEKMQAAGLALGGSMENAIVVDNGRILNDGGLRFEDEFAWHKALDLVGDLALVGRPILASITAHKCGHDLNNRFVRSVLERAQSV